MIEQEVVKLLAQVVHEAEHCGAGPLCTAAVFPGVEVPWDYAGDCGSTCGFAYVRLMTSFPYDVFPQPAFAASCINPPAHQLAVGIIRCLPVMEDDGDPPSPDDISANALDRFKDQRAIRSAIIKVQPRGSMLGAWQPLGPLGGNVGGEWNVYVPED